MKIVAALIKEGQAIDTWTFEIPRRDDLAEAAKMAFAYFRDRYPHLTTTIDDVMIAFRDEDKAHESAECGVGRVPSVQTHNPEPADYSQSVGEQGR